MAARDRTRRTIATPARGRPAQAAIRVLEVVLILVGVRFTIGDPSTTNDLEDLLLWDVLAVGYLGAGLVSVLRHRSDSAVRLPAVASAPGTSRLDRALYSYRFKTLFTVGASLTGMAAASTVIINRDDEKLGNFITAAGVVAILLAWTLLHSAYAQLYAALYFRPGPAGGGLEFPDTAAPNQVDFLYFAFILGTSFAGSDVTVTSRELRWRVMVHSIVSFFYNAIVLALAINILLGL